MYRVFTSLRYHSFSSLRMRILWVLLSLLFCSDLIASDPTNLKFNEGMEQSNIAPYISFMEVEDTSITFDYIKSLPENQWEQYSKNAFSQGYSSSRWWMRVSITNGTASHATRLLEISYPLLDYIDIYIKSDSDLIEHHLGDKLPFSHRPMNHRNFVVPINWDPQETLVIYLSVASSSSIQVPITLWKVDTFHSQDAIHVFINGLYFGMMLIMVMYNFFVFLGVGDRNYFFYVLFVICMPTFIASLTGFSFQYLWPEATQWNDQSILVSLSGALIFGVLFTHFLLKAYELKGFTRNIGPAIAVGSLFLVLFSFIMPYRVMIIIIIPFACFTCSYGIALGIYRWWQGETSARYYTIAWGSLLVGGVVLAFSKFGFIPKNMFTDYSAQFGSALEVMLLSFALAERINQERRLRYQAKIESNLKLEAKNVHIQQVLEATGEMAKSTQKHSASSVALDYLRKLDDHIDLHNANLYLPQKNSDGFALYKLCQDGELINEYMSESVPEEKNAYLQSIQKIKIDDGILILPIKSETQTLAYLEIDRYCQDDKDIQVSQSILEGISQSLLLKLDNLDAEENRRLSGIGAMAAAIVHDLKNPIGAIMGYAELAKANDLNVDIRNDYLDVIIQEAERLSSMAHEVLEFSRGEMNLDIEPIDSEPYAKDIGRILLPIFEQGGIKLSIQVEYKGNINLDCERMRRVILNLATNACDAMINDHTKHPSFTLAFSKVNDVVTISAEDNGPGIPEHIKATLFEPFTTHGKSDGTGLGMAIVKKMVIAHGGNIQFESAPEVGTTFFIELPQPIIDESAKVTADPNSIYINDPEDEENIPSGTKTVLITDDNIVNLKLVKAYVTKLNYKTRLATSGEEALSILKSESIDLILMDIEMPGLSGVETTNLIRSSADNNWFSDIPVIALTAHEDQEQIKGFNEAGFNHHLTKPIDRKILAQVLHKHLLH